jgi:hypothetical protein
MSVELENLRKAIVLVARTVQLVRQGTHSETVTEMAMDMIASAESHGDIADTIAYFEHEAPRDLRNL